MFPFPLSPLTIEIFEHIDRIQQSIDWMLERAKEKEPPCFQVAVMDDLEDAAEDLERAIDPVWDALTSSIRHDFDQHRKGAANG